MNRKEEIRDKALTDLQQYHVLMLDGHFDFGNGYHGKVYLNPHQLFRYPSTIWRFAQDLLDVLPGSIVDETEVVSGPPTGGALLAHTIAGLLDSRRAITRPTMRGKKLSQPRYAVNTASWPTSKLPDARPPAVAINTRPRPMSAAP